MTSFLVGDTVYKEELRKEWGQIYLSSELHKPTRMDEKCFSSSFLACQAHVITTFTGSLLIVVAPTGIILGAWMTGFFDYNIEIDKRKS